jgi:mannosyl-oligosaccharide alpha-1,3-glucosidase
MRLRRSSKLMYFDPFTLVVAPTAAGKAHGTLYLDDEHTLAHENVGAFVHRAFTFENNVLTCSAAPAANSGAAGSGVVLASNSKAEYRPPNTVERIEFAGQEKGPKKIILRTKGQTQGPGQELVGLFDPARKVITVKKPDSLVADDWTITLEF